MTIQEMRDLVAFCAFQDYAFDVTEGHGGIYLQGRYVEADVRRQTPEVQYTRKWLLSPGMVKSEVVQTVFKCIATSMEHRAREGFRYKGRRIFGPHYNVDALWEICHYDANLDYRRGQDEAH